ncbi:hypothetical protein TWF281_003304 [Arthrobotrys megalospora]
MSQYISSYNFEPLARADIPVEIWRSIYSFLGYNDLVEVSRCCKYLRQVALPLIFRNVRLTEDSIRGFGEGGSLSHIVPSVRDVSFSIPTVTPHDSETLRRFEPALYFCRSLEIFPSIRGVHFTYPSNELFYWIFPIAILRAIAKYPWFNELRSLSIEGLAVDCRSTGGDLRSQVSREAIDFALGGRQVKDIAFDTTVPFPPALKNLSIYYIGRSCFRDFYQRDYRAIDPSEGPGYTTPLLYRHWTNALTNLTIRTSYLYTSSPCRPVLIFEFTTVTNLHIMVDYYGWADLAIIAPRFPNLREFRLETARFSRERSAYNFLYGFPRLKRASVPWRCALEWESPHCTLENIQPGVGPAVLREEVDALIGDGLVARLEDLEYVDFVRGYHEIGQLWVNCVRTPYKDYEVEICRVWRDGGRWDVRKGDGRMMG